MIQADASQPVPQAPVLAERRPSVLARRWQGFGKLIDGVPLMTVEDGKPLQDRMDRERLSEDEIMEAARELQGLERLEQVRYAILERNGHITIIPR